MPDDVKDEVGHSLRLAQQGSKADNATAMKGKLRTKSMARLISRPARSYDDKKPLRKMKAAAKRPRRLRPGDVTVIHGTRIEEGSGNVFADLGLPDAEERLAKSRLAALITETIKRKGWTQAEAAERLDTYQPTISALRKGTLNSITYDRLIAWLVALGRPVEIRIRPETRREAHVEVAIAGR